MTTDPRIAAPGRSEVSSPDMRDECGYPPHMDKSLVRTSLLVHNLRFRFQASGQMIACLCSHSSADRAGLRFLWTEAGDAPRRGSHLADSAVASSAGETC
jgi:hypothetical protein